MQHPTNQPNPSFTCNSPINTGPATFVLRAAMATPQPLDRQRDAAADGAATRHDQGSARRVDTGLQRQRARRRPHPRGGRTRRQAERLRAERRSQFCVLFGTTTPFTTAQLEALYRNHGGFVSRWNQATQYALQGGFIVAEDAQHLRRVAAQSDVP